VGKETSISSETAIARFLSSGGRISRLTESVSISESELLAYLATCGIVARYAGGDRRAYLCRNKRMSLSALIALANQHRSSDALPPFALNLNPAPTRSRARNHMGAE
jgi:hypothetical protein